MARQTLARLTALALATGTLVAAAGPASAATTTTERVFDATGAGSVLRIEINLPAEVPGLLPQKIVQDIALSSGAARTGKSPLALGSALIGKNGNVSLLQGLLDGKAEATLEKATSEYALASLPANPLGLTGGALSAVSKVSNPNADGVLSSSTTSIAGLDLKGAGALDAVLAPLQDALEQALGATTAVTGAPGSSPVAPVTTTVTEVVNTALDALDEVTAGGTAPVSEPVRQAVDTVTAELNALLSELTSQVATLSATDSLLTVGLIETAQSVTRTGSTVTSRASNELVGIEVLGGLIDVSGIESTAVASLGGSAPSAEANATVLKAVVGDVITLEVADRLQTILGGTVGDALPADVLQTVNTTLATVNELVTSSLGLSMPVQAKTSESASADAASAVVEPASLVIDPLRSGTAPLLRMGFVPASAQVTAQSITSRVNAPTTATPTALPRTGGSLPVALAGAALLGVALVARRRRTAEV